MKAPQRFLAVAISAMGVSVVGQGLAFARQILIAAYFGVSRELDIYFVAYAVAAMIIFNSSTVFDASVVPRLVGAREAGGELILANFAARLFRLSWLLGVAATAMLIAIMPLLAPLVASGFSEEQRDMLIRFVWLFAPWTLCSLPYYATAAAHKARRSFNRVFAAELVVTVVSIGYLVAFHDSVSDLPLAYAAGYACALLALVPGSGVLGRAAPAPQGEPMGTLRSAGGLYAANQVTSVTGVVDRYFQSHVQPGGIAAITYSTQLITGLVGLLMFREIFIVPMAESDRRTEKLERLIIGLLLLVVPVTGFIVAMSSEIVTVLFQRGRFDVAAAELTASVLAVYALSLVTSVILTPLARMLSILDRVRGIYAMHISSLAGIVVFGYAFVMVLGLGARGVSWTLVLSSLGAILVANALIARCGITLAWRRIARYVGFAVAVAAVAAAAALVAARPFDSAWLRLPAAGTAYAVVVAAFYYAVRDRLLAISGHRSVS